MEIFVVLGILLLVGGAAWGVVRLMIWQIHRDAKIAREKEAAEDKILFDKGNEWLSEENKKPKSKLLVTTKSGSEYHSKYFKPCFKVSESLFWGNGSTLSTVSSYNLACNASDLSFKREYFLSEESDERIPMCEIKSIKILTEVFHDKD